MLAVWGERDGADPINMSFKRSCSDIACLVPDPDCVIRRTRGNPLAIWGERNGSYCANVPFERPCNDTATLHIPDSDSLVIRARGDALAIRRECDRANPTGVSHGI